MGHVFFEVIQNDWDNGRYDVETHILDYPSRKICWCIAKNKRTGDRKRIKLDEAGIIIDVRGMV